MEVIKPPTALPRVFKDRPSFFLVGSIDTEENWRQQVERSLKNYDCTILNPLREDWDSSWRQSIDEPCFKAQVTWELEALERVHHILMYLHPATKAPISLLEAGLSVMGVGGELVIACPEGFYRKGNVDILCERYDVPQVAGLDALIQYAVEEIKRWEKTHAGTAEWRLNGR